MWLGEASAAARQPQNLTPSQIAALADRATREILTPVKDSLIEQLRSDPKLAALVSSVTLHTLSTPRPHVGRNAGATTEQGLPVVLVDLVFLGELTQIGQFGAIGLMSTAEATALIQSTLVERNRQLAAAAAGARLPAFEVGLDNLGGAGVRDVAVRLGVEVSLTTAAWLILHEIGHHVLGHVAPKVAPSSLKDSRDRELGADAWANRKLYELGYHLLYLHAFFQAKDVLQELALKHGFDVPEASSTHPLYATRLAELNKQFDVDKASPARMLSFLGTSWDGRPVEVWIPRYPDEDAQFVATIWAGPTTVSTVCDWVTEEAHVYGRSLNELTEITVHTPGSMRPRVTMVNRRRDTGEAQKRQQTWMQTTLAWARSRQVAKVPVSSVLDGAVVGVLRNTLRDAGVDAKTSATVMDQYRGFFTSLRKELVRYARGERTLKEFAAVMETRSADFSTRLRQTLGQKWVKAVEQQFLSNPTVTAMTDAVIGAK
jgi:hypothetical protein